jgi:hypothetical protein
MAKLDLSAVTEIEADVTELVTSTPPNLSLAPQSYSPGISGDVTSDDIKVPRINIVQKMSDALLEAGFAAGEVVYAKEVRLLPLGVAGKVTFLHLQKQFQQKLPYGSDTMPVVVNTEAEVLERGGSLDYDGANPYQPIAHLTCLVEAPDKLTDEQEAFFPFEFDGKFYALAKWTVASTAYKDVAVPLLTAAKFFLKNGLHSISWSLSVRKMTKGSNSWYAPKIVQAGKNSPEFMEFVSSFLS